MTVVLYQSYKIPLFIETLRSTMSCSYAGPMDNASFGTPQHIPGLKPNQLATPNQEINQPVNSTTSHRCFNLSAHQLKRLSLNTSLNPLIITIQKDTPHFHRRSIPIIPGKHQIHLLPGAAVILNLGILNTWERVLSGAELVCWSARGLTTGCVFIEAGCAGAENSGDGELYIKMRELSRLESLLIRER